MWAELRIFEQAGERPDRAAEHLQATENASQVLEWRLRFLPAQPVRRKRPFHLRVCSDHRAARIALAAQVLDRRLDRRDHPRLEGLFLLGARLVATTNVDP